MPKKMIVNVADEESRVAIVDNKVLEEFETETRRKESIKGHVYKGKILNIELSFQAIFVDYGRDRPGFLPFSEVTLIKNGDAEENNDRRGLSSRVLKSLKVDQEILVQVTKDEVGHKGATLSMNISLPARYIVLMPYNEHLGISRRIVDEEQRKRIKEIFDNPEEDLDRMGVIVRTAGVERTKEELLKDYEYLSNLWKTILDKSDKAKAPEIIHKEQDFMIRCIRDYFSSDIDEVLIDNKECYKEAKDFFRMVMPKSSRIVHIYQSKKPIFSQYDLDTKIEEIYKRKVYLRSGAYIVIDPTEALVSIDVNSGSSTKEKNIEETAFKTNMEAAEEVARQLRLRDLGGLIVIDFIDMKNPKNVREVEKVLKNSIKKDKAKIKTTKISRFGMLEMSRQRLKSAIRDGSFEECPYCKGDGKVKSVEIQSLAILRKIQKESHSKKHKQISVKAPTQVVDYIQNVKRTELYMLEKENNLRILLERGNDIHGEEFTFTFLKKDGSLDKSQSKRSDSNYQDRRAPSARKGVRSSRYKRYPRNNVTRNWRGQSSRVNDKKEMNWDRVFRNNMYRSKNTTSEKHTRKENPKTEMNWDDVFSN